MSGGQRILMTNKPGADKPATLDALRQLIVSESVRLLALYIGFNVEHFAFAERLGACIGPLSPQPDVLNSCSA